MLKFKQDEIIQSDIFISLSSEHIMDFPKDYPNVMAVALAMNWQTWFFGITAGTRRYKLFNQDFMEKEFGDQHKRQLGERIGPGGFPDTGNGLYSQKLSYRDWYRYNVDQRIHLNAVEGLPLAQLSLLAAGYYEPRVAACLGMANIIGRVMYSVFIKKKAGANNKLRIVGYALIMLSSLINSGIFVYNFAKNLKK